MSSPESNLRANGGTVPGRGRRASESCRLRHVRAVGRPASRRGGTACTEARRGPDPGARHDREQDRCGLRAGQPFVSRLISGFPRPRWRILGTELAGTVEATGAAVTQFAAGDEVFGVNAWRFGAHAEFVCMRERGPLAPKPVGLGFEEAAAVCDGAALALGCLRAASVRPGRSILIYGASGSIGTAAVQLASYLGADVTAVCNTENVELVSSLGADFVIDYTRPRTSRRTARPTASSSMRSECSRSAAAGTRSGQAAPTWQPIICTISRSPRGPQ